jgi:hypothetical protein
MSRRFHPRSTRLVPTRIPRSAACTSPVAPLDNLEETRSHAEQTSELTSGMLDNLNGMCEWTGVSPSTKIAMHKSGVKHP